MKGEICENCPLKGSGFGGDGLADETTVSIVHHIANEEAERISDTSEREEAIRKRVESNGIDNPEKAARLASWCLHTCKL